MPGKIIAANWKMNKTAKECYDFFKQFKPLLPSADAERIILICPAFTTLYAASRAATGTSIKICSQDIYCEEKGPYTGEISAAMLKEQDVMFAIVGHSERRYVIGEDNIIINKKLLACLKNDIVPILCVGERIDEKEKGIAKKVIGEQLKECLSGVSNDQIRKVVIAYEPVWAISKGDGKGETASPEYAQEMHKFIRNTITTMYDRQNSRIVYILYGGSVNRNNAASFAAKSDINGFLVGGASLDPIHFADIIKLS
jgi:triosephosphate isomerase (TIM)